MSLYRDRQGNPLSTKEWLRLFEDHDYCVISQKYFDHIHVSTIWVGIDTFGAGQNLFETVCFLVDPDGGIRRTVYEAHYDTEEEAISGHKIALSAARDLERGFHRDLRRSRGSWVRRLWRRVTHQSH